jgi:hypothetical protein
LTALYNYSKLTRARFHLASIDAQVPYSTFDPFNKNYMRAVYNLGWTNPLRYAGAARRSCLQ